MPIRERERVIFIIHCLNQWTIIDDTNANHIYTIQRHNLKHTRGTYIHTYSQYTHGLLTFVVHEALKPLKVVAASDVNTTFMKPVADATDGGLAYRPDSSAIFRDVEQAMFEH
jgi:hypothetical protein